MSIFKVGKEVPDKTPHDMYELEVRYMHGDADFYTTKNTRFALRNKDMLVAIAHLLHFMREEKPSLRSRRHLFPAIAERAGIWSNVELEEILENYLEYDETTHGTNFCSIDEIKYYYYDHNKTKYEVSIEINWERAKKEFDITEKTLHNNL